MISSLTHVSLLVKDYDEALDWYILNIFGTYFNIGFLLEDAVNTQSVDNQLRTASDK